MRTFFCSLLLASFMHAYSQPNCEALLYFGDTLKYEACKKAEEVKGHYQFSKEYQMILDQSIAIDSTFAYAYTRKSVAYLKSGDFITWKKLIDLAVKHDPKEYLGHRGYIRFKCFRDYNGAIRDIEKLNSLIKLDIGYSAIGKEHLIEARALCYKSIGQEKKAIQIIEEHLKESSDFGLTEHLHLGVLYLNQGDYHKALSAFALQSKEYEFAENQYYQALAYKSLNMKNEYKGCLEKAKELYLSGFRMFDIYIDPIDKIYLETIESELAVAAARHK